MHARAPGAPEAPRPRGAGWRSSAPRRARSAGSSADAARLPGCAGPSAPWRRSLLGLRRLPEPGDRAPDDARHVHLGDAHALPDLRLCEVLAEAQPQDLALAVGEHAHQALDGGRVLGEVEAGVLDPERGRHALALLVLLVTRAVEGDRPVGGAGLARLEHLLEADAGALGDLGGSRRAPELAGQLVGDAVDPHGELLEVARHPDRPPLVAEVALELTEDRRHGEGGERGLALGIEAVDRLQQPERGDLDQVVELLAAALIAAGELAGQRQEALDEGLARGPIAAVV